MERKHKKYLTREEALKKLQSYCAYQDRCHKEVRSKLLDLGVYGDDLEEVIIDLIDEKFLDEERFARSYTRGKFRFKKWGRMKIKQELKRKEISAYCLKKAMEEIEEEDYINTLDGLIKKKNSQLTDTNDYHRKQKIAQFVFRKGYESNLIWERINDIL